jgi:GNAT superfamily N-acetyltransferase
MARSGGGDDAPREDAAPAGDATRREDAAPRDVAISPVGDEPSLRAAMEAVGALEYDAREVALLASLGFDGPLRHYAAVRDGAPVGIASTFAWRETVTLTQLAVAPAWRRRGIGRALVQHVARGVTLLAPTPATIPFYAALGFRLLRCPPDRAFYLPV